MERHLDTGLEDLKARLINMSALTEKAIDKAVKALVDKDEVMAMSVKTSDEPINTAQMEIDRHCLKLLALYQPEAGDLRFIMMAFKINNELERIGDLAVNIAERTLDLLRGPNMQLYGDIPSLAKLTRQMVRDSLDSFVRSDGELARQVCKRDDEVDRLNYQIFDHLLENRKGIVRSIGLILISRSLERIADHATNIAEGVIYMVSGKDIRHHHLDPEAPQTFPPKDIA